MIYPIYVYGSPVLTKVAEPVPADYADFPKLVSDMFETMYASDGVGLAAPQIGKSLNMFVIDASVYSEGDPELESFKKTFLNAEIYGYTEETLVSEEGCLSYPGIHEDVTRPEGIRIRYYDENFAAHDEEYHGRIARIIQHEYDHLLGKSFIDRLSPLRRTLLKSKLNAMAKGKFSADYKCKISK